MVNAANDIGLLPLDGKGQVTALIRTKFAEGRATLSPDGRWLGSRVAAGSSLVMMLNWLEELKRLVPIN